MSRLNFNQFIHDDHANAAIEYLIIAGLISIPAIAGIQEYRTLLIGMFDDLARELRNLRF